MSHVARSAACKQRPESDTSVRSRRGGAKDGHGSANFEPRDAPLDPVRLLREQFVYDIEGAGADVGFCRSRVSAEDDKASRNAGMRRFAA